MKIGILTGGGDVPPLNIVINTVREIAVKSGNTLIGFVNGWQGVLSNNTISLNDYSNFSSIGGTFLKSSRINLLFEDNGVEKANLNLNQLGIEGLIIIGGDDTLSNAYYISQCPCLLVSRTIDNDIGFIDDDMSNFIPQNIINYFTLGFPTAANKIATYASLDQGLRTTAYSHERIIILESMGMHSGWLALASGYGDPDFIIVPEYPIDYAQFCEKLIELYLKQKHAIVVVAEGAKFNNDKYIKADYGETDNFENPRFGGSSLVLRDMLKEDLKKSFDTRNINAVNPSYLYRSGKPNNIDREISVSIGKLAIEMLLKGTVDGVTLLSVALENKDFVVKSVPLTFFKQTENDRFPKRQINSMFYDEDELSLTTNGYEYFKHIIDESIKTDFGKSSKNKYCY